MVCVVGGGAAGMMAALGAVENGKKVVLIEKNEKLGKKLFLTGKGRCNLTNACDMEELFSNIVHNPKFLYSALYSFDNQVTMDYFKDNGLSIKIERGNRVFPTSDHSSDVIGTLQRALIKAGVRIELNKKVTDIIVDKDNETSKISGVILNDGTIINSDSVILATGGNSYASTGSDGSFFDILSKYNIDIKHQQPSLVPLSSNDDYVKNMQGLALKNVSITLKVNGKKKYEGFGEMLFTHFGVSGPLILSASTSLNEDDYSKKIDIAIDLKPALSADELDKRILRDFNDNQNKIFENVLGKLLPNKMITSVIQLSGIDSQKRVNMISKQERQSLVALLKAFPVNISGNRGFNEAIITRGGVSVKEINPSTMESKKVEGLFFAGEMIDVDALTGGFNLQIAWSTGRLAGLSC